MRKQSELNRKKTHDQRAGRMEVYRAKERKERKEGVCEVNVIVDDGCQQITRQFFQGWANGTMGSD